MLRNALAFFAHLSLALLVALTAACLSGVYLGSVWTVGRMATFTNRDGNLGLALFVDDSADASGRVFEPFRDHEVVAGNVRASPGASSRGIRLAGLVIDAIPVAPAPTPLRAYRAFFPWWWWSGLLAALPAGRAALAWRRRRVRARRRGAGRCVRCDYDLRATPEAGGAVLDQCPECGAMPERASEQWAGSPRQPGAAAPT